MKLSITVLSSILAVCSANAANPVYPSSTLTTSTEASTSTTSPSATSTGESIFTAAPGPYAQYLAECFPIDEEGIFMIWKYAQTKIAVGLFDVEYGPVRDECNAQIEKINELKDDLEGLEDDLEVLKKSAGGSNEVSSLESKIAELKVEVTFRHNTVRGPLKKERQLNLVHLSLRGDELRAVQALLTRFLSSDGSTTPSVNDIPLLYLVPGFKQCFGKFYDGPLE
ncbi:hypothetical protein QVD99_002884 [Batrachochytrium dendrobatidis]|nr:hypothetical protein QVD99_002884 [Batrachochytrium dendrobatidis]